MSTPIRASRILSATFVLLLFLVGATVVAVWMTFEQPAGCGTSASAVPTAISLGPPGTGQLVGATEYGGPGDPSSGTVGALGVSLIAHPDSYAELGGTDFQTATAMGGLPYMTPLRITWAGRSAIAYKRDFGLGGGPIGALPRVIDLWWQLAGALGVPYENGLWSGPVKVQRPPAAGAGNLLGGVPAAARSVANAGVCVPGSTGAPTLTPGPRAQLLPDGLATAPAGAPAAVKGMIAAGNQIAGKPYVYGGGHGIPLDQVAPSYDCSSSVSHLLWGGGLLPASGDQTSGTLESFGAPGPGRWVTIYASGYHVFMYVAGLRWDTHDAAGPGDGSTGIGWHPLVRDATGFVVRHPAGL
ncbi:MAG: hypothetical protein ACYDHH_16615 [Solirubrobacteraceae bacterium]